MIRAICDRNSLVSNPTGSRAIVATTPSGNSCDGPFNPRFSCLETLLADSLDLRERSHRNGARVSEQLCEATGRKDGVAHGVLNILVS
jgi:hypothetical protein